MISLLIPVFNYDITPLIDLLHNQLKSSDIDYEIVIIDDASTQSTYDPKQIANYDYTELIALQKNIGRSAIRNLLAQKAKYDNLIFIDAGTIPKSKTFIADYIETIGKSVVIGGMIEHNKKPKKPFRLRWLFTKTRETYTKKDICTSANFLVKKSVILSYPFDESVKQYGYEDLFFFNTLKANSIELFFIDNPVIHDYKEDAYTFMRKIEQGLENLATFSVKHQELLEDNNIIKSYKKLSALRMTGLVIYLFKLIRSTALKNFNSSYPSMLLFDLYRLGYFCTIKRKL